MELVILGSAGWVPQEDRMTTALAVRWGDSLLLLDAGTGLARLREPAYRRLLPSAGRPVHIFLSHYHLDHTAGLTYLPALWSENPTVIHAPAPEGQRVEDLTSLLESLVGPPFFPHGFSGFPFPVAVEPLTPGTVVVEPGDPDAVGVDVRAQRHPGSSLGFRVGNALAFLTDTAYDPEAAAFVEGVPVLVHEAWVASWGAPGTPQAGRAAHVSAEEAARTARDGRVGELLLSHLPPHGDEAAYAEMLAAGRTVFPATQLCRDGLSRLLRVAR